MTNPITSETSTSFDESKRLPSFVESKVADCQLMELPRVATRSGSLTAVQSDDWFPVSIRRVYYLFDVPGGASRGGHAHHELVQLLVAASGSFEVVLDDGKSRKVVILNRPYQGLLIVPGIWREIQNFSSGSICLVLASEKYAEEDYVRDYRRFLTARRV